MDVAFVTNVVYPFVEGGAQKRVYEIGTRLSSKGHDVSIYGRHYWDGPVERDQEGMTLRAVASASELYTNDGKRSIREAIDFATRLGPPLRSHIDEHDLVVASVFPYLPVLTARLCSVRTETPLVTTWHEVWREYWEDYLGPLALCGKTVEHVTACISQYPIAVSNVTADRLAEIGPSRDRIETVPNGIDIDRIRSASAVEDGFDVLFVGRLIEDKHVDRLIRAFDRADFDGTLGIIGDGPKREELEEETRGTTTSDRITFLGFLDEYDEVLGHMKAASVFASPSTREGFGITYIEAMAADCIVIGANHPYSAASEIIDDAGFVVEPNTDALTEALNKVLDGGRPNRDPKAVASQYDWDSIAEEAEEVYRNIIDHSRT